MKPMRTGMNGMTDYLKFPILKKNIQNFYSICYNLISTLKMLCRMRLHDIIQYSETKKCHKIQDIGGNYVKLQENQADDQTCRL